MYAQTEWTFLGRLPELPVFFTQDAREEGRHSATEAHPEEKNVGATNRAPLATTVAVSKPGNKPPLFGERSVCSGFFLPAGSDGPDCG
jgi:hypothetical protein